MVALVMGAPLGSEIVPVSSAAPAVAGRRRAARGIKKQSVAKTASNLAFADKQERFTDGFNIAANLLSRFEGPATVSAEDKARREGQRVPARRSNWFA